MKKCPWARASRIAAELHDTMSLIRADFQEGDEDSNFPVFRIRRFTESPGPLHWIAFPLEILTNPPIHWIASPLFTENPFFSLKSASSHPLPKNRLWTKVQGWLIFSHPQGCSLNPLKNLHHRQPLVMRSCTRKKGWSIPPPKYCPHRNDYNLNSWQI